MGNFSGRTSHKVFFVPSVLFSFSYFWVFFSFFGRGRHFTLQSQGCEPNLLYWTLQDILPEENVHKAADILPEENVHKGN